MSSTVPPDPVNGNEQPFTLGLGTVTGARENKVGSANDTWDVTLLLDDGRTTYAVAKDIPAQEMANEILGAALAHECGLPVPRIFLVEADIQFINAEHGIPCSASSKILVASEKVSAPSVARRWKSGSRIPQEFVDELIAWPYCGQAIAFDAWVANIDRNEGNLLFGDGSDIWLIDHGCCFTGPTWRPEHLDPEGFYANVMADWLRPRLTNEQVQSMRQAVLMLCEKIKSVDVKYKASEFGIISLLNSEMVAALTDFLNLRMVRVPGITGRATGIEGLL